MSLASFILAVVFILLTPGPTNTILAASGAAMGWRGAMLLPLAEAAGYLLAVTACLALADAVSNSAAAMQAMKAVAAVWLLFSAWKLWHQKMQSHACGRTVALRRVFLTTLLNPKAMLVGAILIPGMEAGLRMQATAAFIALSLAAGALWTLFGSSLPGRVTPYAYRIAAVVVGLFSVAAASGAIAG